MKTSDFDFHLPEELIARYPLEKRSDSRLLLLNANRIEHRHFTDLPALLNEHDMIIFNDTRVMPARLYAHKTTGGKIEILIERILSDNFALAHVKSNKSLTLPITVGLENGVKITLVDRQKDLFRLHFESSQCINDILQEVGVVPIPQYMKRSSDTIDKERYQTVYSKHEGAVAAPTAGLHFDELLLSKLRELGIQMGFITLHVGAGTFKPVIVESIDQHTMHQEFFEISPEVCERINATKAKGGRIIAVGTTSVRALETAMQQTEVLTPYAGETDIFIYPGYRFRCVDAFITNFHLPKTTLLMLVCAFGGYQEVMNSYQEAIAQHYRFYSYGDAMLIYKNPSMSR